MVTKFFVFTFLAIVASTQQTTSAECVIPKSVVNITLDTDHILSWAVEETEPCDITQYFVLIFNRVDTDKEYILTVYESKVDVSFLEVCQEWVFSITASSGDIWGREKRLVAYLPIPTNANLTISSIRIRTEALRVRHLEWDLADSSLRNCTLQYRLTVEIEGNPVIEDIYLTEKSINLRFLSPCTTYLFGVRVINVGFPTIEGPLKQESISILALRQGHPRLVSVIPTYNGFTTSWLIESVERNACRLRSFFLDGGLLFSQTLVLDERDDRNPINVTVSGLRHNTMYYFRAYLVNTGGYSRPTSAAVQTLNFSED